MCQADYEPEYYTSGDPNFDGTVRCKEQDCAARATHHGVHASSDCLVQVCKKHNDEITTEGHWVPGFEGRLIDEDDDAEED